MRFNLKNRPKCDDYAGQYVIYEEGREYKGYCHRDMEKWFEGFEKELKKLLHDFPDIDDSKYWVKIKETKGSKAFNSLMYIADVLFWKDKLEKEILGES